MLSAAFGGLVSQVLVGPVGLRQTRVRRHDDIRRARERPAGPGAAGAAARRRGEAGDRDAADCDVGAPAIRHHRGHLHGLPADHQPIVGQRLEREAVGEQRRVGKVGFLRVQPEVDLVTSGIGQPHRAEPGAQRANRRETGNHGSRRPRIVARLERLLRALRLLDDRREAGHEGGGRVGAGELREAGQAGVHAVEQRGFVLVHLARNRGVDQPVARRSRGTAAAPDAAGQRRHLAHALALVVAARVRADLLVGSAEQFVVGTRVNRRGVFALGRRRRARWLPADDASPAGEVQLLRLPRPQPGLDLLGELRRVGGGAECFPREHRGRLVRAVPSPSLDRHRQHDVGALGPDEVDEVADHFLAAPLLVDLVRVERVAVVDRAGEPLLCAVEAVRRQELRRPEHSHVAKQLGPDFVLAPFAARRLHVDGPQALAEREQRVELVVLVVGMSGRLEERARHAEAAQGDAERDVPVVLGDERDHPRLRVERELTRGGEHERQDQGCPGEHRQSFHKERPRSAARTASGRPPIVDPSFLAVARQPTAAESPGGSRPSRVSVWQSVGRRTFGRREGRRSPAAPAFAHVVRPAHHALSEVEGRSTAPNRDSSFGCFRASQSAWLGWPPGKSQLAGRGCAFD